MEGVHKAARSALNFTRFSIHDPSTSDDIKRLVEFYCSQGREMDASSMFEEFVHVGASDEGNTRMMEAFFKARLLFIVCNRFMEVVPENAGRGCINFVLDLLWHMFLKHHEEIPLEEARAYSVKVEAEHVRAFYFWRWQYVQRNKGYRKLQDSAQRILSDETLKSSIIPIDMTEYPMVPPLQMQQHLASAVFGKEKRPFSWVAEHVEKLNALTETSRRKYQIFIAWPLPDYGSDVILQRVLSGEFKYWERPSPPSFPIDRPPSISEHKQIDFEKLWSKYAKACYEVYNLGGYEGLAYAQGVEKYYNAQKEYGEIVSHEVVKRVRLEAEHRAIGLWLWDYVDANQCSGVEAGDAVIQGYPELEDFEGSQWNAICGRPKKL